MRGEGVQKWVYLVVHFQSSVFLAVQRCGQSEQEAQRRAEEWQEKSARSAQDAERTFKKAPHFDTETQTDLLKTPISAVLAQTLLETFEPPRKTQQEELRALSLNPKLHKAAQHSCGSSVLSLYSLPILRHRSSLRRKAGVRPADQGTPSRSPLSSRCPGGRTTLRCCLWAGWREGFQQSLSHG